MIAALELANMGINDTDLHLAAIQASIITSALAKAPDPLRSSLVAPLTENLAHKGRTQ